jgi:uncharacterized damage-inducible protein DinB
MSSPDQAKAIAAAMIGLWRSELPATVRVLSAVRDETRDYRPHERSRSAWELAVHIATADLWFISSIERGEFHFDREAAKQAEAQFTRISEVVAFYEAMIPAGLQKLEAMSADQLAESLDFMGMRQISRAEWIGAANNHSVHHRGQLSAYLRALGARVPDIYGPSGDAAAPEASA